MPKKGGVTIAWLDEERGKFGRGERGRWARPGVWGMNSGRWRVRITRIPRATGYYRETFWQWEVWAGLFGRADVGRNKTFDAAHREAVQMLHKRQKGYRGPRVTNLKGLG